MDWGSFAGGFAKTFDPKAVGGAINERWAQSERDDVLAKGKEIDDQLAALDTKFKGQNQAAQGQAVPTQGQAAPAEGQAAPAQAVPTPGQEAPAQAAPAQAGAAPAQGQAIPPQGETAALPAQEAPMSQLDYDEQRAKLFGQKRKVELEGKMAYYKRRGMTDKAMEVEKEIADADWHSGKVDQYYGILRGDKKAIAPVVGFINATSMDGSQYVDNGNGGFNLVDQNGKVLQQDVKFSPQQIQSGFRQFYAAAKFARTGDFDSYMNQAKQEEELALKHANHAETVRSHKASEKSKASELALKQRYQKYLEAKTAAEVKRNALTDAENQRVNDARINALNAQAAYHKAAADAKGQAGNGKKLTTVKMLDSEGNLVDTRVDDDRSGQPVNVDGRTRWLPLNRSAKEFPYIDKLMSEASEKYGVPMSEEDAWQLLDVYMNGGAITYDKASKSWVGDGRRRTGIPPKGNTGD
jgi:hypothetical protein